MFKLKKNINYVTILLIQLLHI